MTAYPYGVDIEGMLMRLISCHLPANSVLPMSVCPLGKALREI